MRKTRYTAAAALAATAALGLTVPHGGSAVAASKKSHRVSIKLFGPPKGTKITGTWKAGSLGHGTMRGTLQIPLTKFTFKRSGGGTFNTTTYNCSNQKVSPPTYRGCWKVTKGTGKFKGITGGGKLSGNFNGHATYSGKVRY